MGMLDGLGVTYRQVVDEVVAEALTVVAEVEREVGTVPGFDELPTRVQLAHYLDDLRGQPYAWVALMLTWAGLGGLHFAVNAVVAESTRLETLLMQAGNWDGTPEDMARAAHDGAAAVRQDQFQRDMRPALAAVERVQAEMAKPAFTVAPDIQAPPLIDGLAGLVMGGEPWVQPTSGTAPTPLSSPGTSPSPPIFPSSGAMPPP